jgi:hypothetical protein
MDGYRLAILGTLIAGIGTVSCADAAPRAPACAEIRSACAAAGFVRGGARAGNGLAVDCIAPIMRGTPQPRRASKPLPQIDQGLIAECKTQNPKFGQRNAPPSQQGGAPPTQGSSSPPATSPQAVPGAENGQL